MAAEDKIVKNQCNRCGLKTNHYERFNHTVSESSPYDSEYSVEFGSTYTFLECCGCSDVSIRRHDWCSEWDHGCFEETFYPPRVSRKMPKNFRSLPEEYQSLIKEIFAALHADSRQLAMMGARSVIDLFLLRKVGDQGNFKQGMNKLEEDGYISKRNREILDAAVEAGHAASHRAHIPTIKELNAVMNIVENLLEHDLLLASADTLIKHTPPRQKPPTPEKEK